MTEIYYLKERKFMTFFFQNIFLWHICLNIKHTKELHKFNSVWIKIKTHNFSSKYKNKQTLNTQLHFQWDISITESWYDVWSKTFIFSAEQAKNWFFVQSCERPKKAANEFLFKIYICHQTFKKLMLKPFLVIYRTKAQKK